MADKINLVTHDQVDEATACKGSLVEAFLGYRCSGCESSVPTRLIQAFSEKHEDHQTLTGRAVVLIEQGAEW